MAIPKASDKTKIHDILKRIKYRSKLEGQRYIDPGEEQVTFEHLDDAGYLKLVKKKFIKPAATAGKTPAEKESK